MSQAAVSRRLTLIPVGPSGVRTAKPARDAANPPFACFYVYPAVVSGTELNAPLRVQPVIRKTAIAQASRFSQVCQVWAPVYRQATIRGLLSSSFSQMPPPDSEFGIAGSDATWVTYPRLYTATCMTKGNVTWLQVTDVARASDRRPVVRDTRGSTFGLHTYDVNLALGNLVRDVRAQEVSYAARRA